MAVSIYIIKMAVLKWSHKLGSTVGVPLLIQSGQKEGIMIKLKVKEVAESKGVSMTKLSHRSEVAFNTIRAIFRDPYRTVNTDTLSRLAKALDVPVLDLIEEVPDDNEVTSD